MTDQSFIEVSGDTRRYLDGVLELLLRIVANLQLRRQQLLGLATCRHVSLCCHVGRARPLARPLAGGPCGVFSWGPGTEDEIIFPQAALGLVSWKISARLSISALSTRQPNPAHTAGHRSIRNPGPPRDSIDRTSKSQQIAMTAT